MTYLIQYCALIDLSLTLIFRFGTALKLNPSDFDRSHFYQRILFYSDTPENSIYNFMSKWKINPSDNSIPGIRMTCHQNCTIEVGTMRLL